MYQTISSPPCVHVALVALVQLEETEGRNRSMAHDTSLGSLMHACRTFYPTSNSRKTLTVVLVVSATIIYHTSNSCECTGVNGEAVQVHAVDKTTSLLRISIRHCNSRDLYRGFMEFKLKFKRS